MGYPVSRVSCIASGRVATDGTGSVLKAVTTARSGAGVYTYTLLYPADATERSFQAFSRTSLLICSYADTSDTVITATWVTVAAGNAATDCAHDFQVMRLSNVA